MRTTARARWAVVAAALAVCAAGCSSSTAKQSVATVPVTRYERGVGPDYDFGTDAPPAALSLDASGQWPLVVRGNPPHEVVSYYAAGAWHQIAAGNAADW